MDIPTRKANLLQRLKELLSEEDFELTDDISLSYSWHHGYEKLDISYASKKGGRHFSGAYHPDAYCHGNPCHFCGWARIE